MRLGRNTALLPKLPLAFLLGVIGIARAAEVPPPLPEVRVVITPSTTNARVKETFALVLRIENPTRTNQTIRAMCCSWDQQWQSSNPKVGWVGWGCGKNFPADYTIPPGGAHTNQLQMVLNDPVPGRPLAFRMGFTSLGTRKTFWSNVVKLRILPPDTWATRAGKYYRDRNHDGKVDWEVSGETWSGHAIDPLHFKTFTNSIGEVIATQEYTGQGVDIYKVDTNYDGFYDLEYGAGGTNGQIQWTKVIHEPVPKVDNNFIPVEKEQWMDWWLPK